MITKIFILLLFITIINADYTCDIVIAGGTLASLGAVL